MFERSPDGLVTLLLAMLVASPAAAKPPPSVRQAATQFFTDLIAGKKASCRKQLMSHAEVSALTTKKISKKEYDASAKQFLERRIAEFAEGRKKHGKVTLSRVEIRDVRILTPENSKLKRRSVHVVVVPFIKTNKGERGGWPFFFIQQGDSWKFMWRK